MTIDEANKMLKAKLECLNHETSGTDYACNQHLCEGCSLNYEQGNMGEQKEALEMAIRALSSWSMYSDELWKKAYARGCNDAKTYILTKIKAEIKELADYDNVDALVEVCRIIDKYREGGAE